MNGGPVPVSIYRGGTSKGVFLRLAELPAAASDRDALALGLLGSPDPMQLDGLGGTHSSTSKLVAVGTPGDAASLGFDAPPDAAVAYLFAQVAVDRPQVDWRGNCGNLTAAVAGYALREGIVTAPDGIAEIALFNVNTGVRVTCRLLVRDGVAVESGDFAIPGVPGRGARIDIVFHDPASAVTGRTLPTGRPLDTLRIGPRTLAATIVDVTNPVVAVRASDLGVAGTEAPAELNADRRFLDLLETIRGEAARRCGLVAEGADAARITPAVPRVIVVAAPVRHRLADGSVVGAADADFVVRTSSMGVIHHAFTGTGLLAAAAAAAIPGTVFDLVGGVHPDGVRLAHPKGVVPLAAEVDAGEPEPDVRSVTMARTARLLMRGAAFPASHDDA